MAYKSGPLSLFYVTSITMPVVVGQGQNRVLLSYVALLGPVLAHAMTPLRLFSRNFGKDVLPGIGIDGILGGGFVSSYVTVNGGYALSQGLFGDIQVPKLQGFATALLGDEFKELATLAAGLRQFDYFGNKGFTDTAGRTTLYARQLRYVPPQSAPAGEAASKTQQDGAFNFVSGHFAQTDIAGYFDVSIAYLTKPTPLLHELSFSVHTEGFQAKSLETTGTAGVALTLGMVTLPNLYDFGIEGGRRFRFGLEFAAGPFSLSLRCNDPQTLAMFPMAYNALDIWAGLKMVSNLGGAMQVTARRADHEAV
jgi:hypothetical protein